ncbi:MAG: AAA family ATPase, partial [bacterium]
MYLSKITIENFRCFGEGELGFELSLKQGLTALVGENDSGKTAVIDALRFALGTTDQEWYQRLEDTDFHEKGENDTSCEIRIVCKFEGLSPQETSAFVEYLTYENEPVFYLNWTAKDTGQSRRGRPYRRVEVHSGKNGDGPAIVQEVREFLRAT